MNNNRRKEIKRISAALNELYNELEKVKDDEEFAFDSMPEGLQYSMRGEESQDAISSLDEASQYLSDAIDSLEEIV